MTHRFISNWDATRDRLPIPAELRARMVEVARDFRKVPTSSERLLWTHLRGRRLGTKFRRQQPIGLFVVDFYCPSHHLIVEVDGPIHESQRDHDQARQDLLEQCGYRLLRVSADEVERDVGGVVNHIAEALKNHPPQLSP